ncbi:hypothetical protein F5B20DRAFT_587109 [Whalleya microplaca]|nr:hypothetical protein F5B20DRAFT_587109 [Whalleya microplaca]
MAETAGNNRRKPWMWPEDYFANDSRRFNCEGLIDAGSFGSVWHIKEEENGVVKRQFAAKYAHLAEDTSFVETEIRIAKKLYGALHIAQPVVVDGKMLELDSVPINALRQRRFVLMTEFLPNLTIAEFKDKAQEQRYWPVPNRILWFIFRCLVRAVIAMANPPDRPYGQDTEAPKLETVPVREPTTDDYQVYHGDIQNENNMIFGELDIGEHRLVPMLKVIDFGWAVDDVNNMPVGKGTITQENIYDIAQVMRSLYGHFDSSFDGDRPRAAFPNLDMDLYNLVARCSNEDPKKRPQISELLQAVQNAIRLKRRPEHFLGKPRASWESNARIAEYVREVLLSADSQG